jgi:hypothetical protein
MSACSERVLVGQRRRQTADSVHCSKSLTTRFATRKRVEAPLRGVAGNQSAVLCSPYCLVLGLVTA